ncbi:hypothetical protein D3C85_1559120 [compost metagenome]
MARQFGVADHRANPHPAVAGHLDLVEAELVDVHHARRVHHVQLHQVQQGGAAGQVGGLGRARVQCDGLLHVRRAGIFEGSHG